MQKLLNKLRFKPEYSALGINVPVSLEDLLKKEGFETEMSPDATYDFVIFTKNHQELDSFLPDVLKKLKYDNLFWIVYPKGSSPLHEDLNRDTLWKAVEKTGYRPVIMVAYNNDWSALRFRPAEKVKTKK